VAMNASSLMSLLGFVVAFFAVVSDFPSRFAARASRDSLQGRERLNVVTWLASPPASVGIDRANGEGFIGGTLAWR